MGHMVAAMRIRQKGLGAVARPFHRPAHFFRSPDADGFLGIDKDFRTEAPTDIRRDHAQFMFGRNANKGGQHQTRDMRILAGGVKGEGIIA